MALFNYLSNISTVSKKEATPLVNNVPSNIEGTRFADIQNPFTNNPREQTIWDRFLNWFGFRSGYDKSQEQYQLASDEYNAQLSQLASEEKYNSPVEQAQRMREAGLNPDLTGVSGEPASEFDNQQQSPDVGIGTDFNPLDVISNVGSLFMSAMTGTASLLKDVSSIKQINQAIESNDYSIAGQIFDLLGHLDPALTPLSEKSHDEFGNALSIHQRLSPLSSLFRSRKSFNRFVDTYLSTRNTLLDQTNKFKSFQDFYDSRKGIIDTISHPYFSPYGADAFMYDSMQRFNKILVDYNEKSLNSQINKAEYESKESQYKSDVVDNLNPADEATAISEGFKADISQARFSQELAPLQIESARLLKALVNALKVPAQKGDLGAQILSFMLNSKIAGVNILGPLVDVPQKAVGAIKRVLQ